MSVKRAITEKPAKSKVKCSPSEELLKAWGVDNTEGTGQKPIDWTKPVRKKKTHEPVEVVTTKARGEYPVLIYLGDDTYTTKCTLEGRFHPGCDIRLENVPEKMKVWIVAHWHQNGRVAIYAAPTITEAKAVAVRVACATISEVEIDVP